MKEKAENPEANSGEEQAEDNSGEVEDSEDDADVFESECFVCFFGGG